MRPDHDPSQLTPDERMHELAAILAAGLVRLRDRAALATQSPPESAGENLAEPSPEALEFHPQTSVTGQGG